jgi:hypothetical protein
MRSRTPLSPTTNPRSADDSRTTGNVFVGIALPGIAAESEQPDVARFKTSPSDARTKKLFRPGFVEEV